MNGPAKAGGSGYNDPEKLKAAMELAQSFRKGPDKGKQPKGSSMRASNQRDRGGMPFAQDRRAASQSRPRPLTVYLNCPPPSQRKYTNTLVSDTSQMGSGPIMGTKAMDFLLRQDDNAKPQKLAATQEPQKLTDIAVVTSATPLVGTVLLEKSTKLQEDNNGEVLKHSQPPTAAAVDQLTVPPVPDTHLEPQLVSQAGQKPRGILPNASSAASQGSQPRPPSRATAKRNILDTFFSLLDEDLEEAPIKTPPTLTSETPIVEKKLTQRWIAKPSDVLASDHEKGHTPQGLNGEAAASSPSQPQNGGKTNDIDQQRDQGLRPDALVFAPGRPDSNSAPQDVRSVTPGHVGNTRLSPEASPWTPDECDNVKESHPSGVDPGMAAPTGNPGLAPQVPTWQSDGQMNAQPLPAQDANQIVQTGPACGHVVSVTPVSFANGFLVPGVTTGQLWLQTPVAMAASTAASSAHNTGARLTNGSSSAAKVQTQPRKPTVGLKGSNWAS
ncbi:hypothetical protein B0T10DRAFT_459057 [Thelonectria olida]|uniref:Uncharacterized protein n=1 Tax=Thelonectria olida TaxID=1576542 RepID=A0A9P9AQF3_9HYPO|nr:hypothetical protein B0T10DRAFT_459057 [Thelonectria olida]